MKISNVIIRCVIGIIMKKTLTMDIIQRKLVTARFVWICVTMMSRVSLSNVVSPTVLGGKTINAMKTTRLIFNQTLLKYIPASNISKIQASFNRCSDRIRCMFI